MTDAKNAVIVTGSSGFIGSAVVIVTAWTKMLRLEKFDAASAVRHSSIAFVDAGRSIQCDEAAECCRSSNLNPPGAKAITPAQINLD